MPSYTRELKMVLALSAPVALTQLGLMTIGVVDTLMLSHLGVESLAAGAVGNAWQWTFLSFGLGLVTGIDPLISQAHGRGDGPAAALGLQRGIVLALLVSIPIMAAMALTERGLLLLGQDPGTVALAARYNLYKLPTVPGFLVYAALRAYLQGRTLMAPATWVMWIGNAVHALLNWALIFGHLGSPPLGVVGAAVASSISTTFMVALLVIWIILLRLHEDAWRPWDRASLSLSGLALNARLGAPIGVQLMLEGSAFSISTWMAGWLGRDALASHQLVLNMAALTFMVPVGIAQGAATRVGNLIGAGDATGLQRAAHASIALGAFVMLFSAAAFALLRFQLPRLYTQDAGVVLLAAQILPVAAAFQVSDGTQVVASGVLRGMGRPDAAAIANLVGYYVVALPGAYLLGFWLDQGLVGIWMGLAAGLALVAGALLVWVRRTLSRPLAALRVRAESPAT